MHTRLILAGVVLAFGLASTAGLAQSKSPVADAARRGDADEVRQLLREGADVKAPQGDGMTALHWAARRGDLAVAGMLIYAGANVDAGTRIGEYTPLHLASDAGNGTLVRALLAAGARVSAATTTSGVTPLHLAAGAGSTDAIGALLDKGAEIDAREGEWGQTPLIFAASANRTAAVKLLLARGANADAVSDQIDIVEWQAQTRAASALQRQILASTVPPGGEPTPSQQQAAIQAARELFRTGKAPDPAAAAGGGRGGAAQPAVGGRGGRGGRGGAAGADPAGQAGSLNEEGPPPAIAAKGGFTSLHHAVRQGYIETAAALLDGGADANRRTGDGNTPLLVALINGQFDAAMLLIERGADPNLPAGGSGVTPLWAAVNVQWQPRTRFPQPQEMELQRATYLDVMKALVDAGADPNARVAMHPWYMTYTGCGNGNCGLTNVSGSTAFWRAAYGTDVTAMRLLVAHGADPNIPTIAPQARGFRGGGGRGGPPPAPAVVAGQPGAAGRSPDDPPAGGPAPPPMPATGDPSGVPVIPYGGPGVYPLHAAAGVEYGEGFAGNAHRHAPDGWMPSVKYLIEELGADVSARDNDGYTPLHHAAARGDNEMILYLVSKGADVTAVSRRGQTTADMANGPVQRLSPFPETIALLVKLGSKNNHRCVGC